jgi:octaprenyl-diphosphate synthase
MTDLKILTLPVEQDIQRARDLYDSFMAHDNTLLNLALSHVKERRGKMLRPLLTILSARLLGAVEEPVIYAAVAFELFHNASLIHDDIVDESDERRGEASINSAFSNKVAVLVGDYMLASSMRAAYGTQSLDLLEIMSKAAQRLCDGELLQLRNVHNQRISEETYYRIIDAKTAALFEACARSGALLSGAAQEDVDRMTRFGQLVGRCFQIRDDIFDYIAGAEIGKPTGNDMQEGKLTLPVIHALKSTSDQQMLDIALRVKEGTNSRDEIERLVQFTLQHDGIGYAERVMEQLAQEARQLLDVYAGREAQQTLCQFVDYVVERRF